MKTSYLKFGFLVYPLNKNKKVVYDRNGGGKIEISLSSEEFAVLLAQKNFKKSAESGSLIIAEDSRSNSNGTNVVTRTKAIFNDYVVNKGHFSSMTVNGWLKFSAPQGEEVRIVQGVFKVSFGTYDVLIDFNNVKVKNREYSMIEVLNGIINVYYGKKIDDSSEIFYNSEQIGTRNLKGEQGTVEYNSLSMNYLFNIY